jgi:cell division protease FtsH
MSDPSSSRPPQGPNQGQRGPNEPTPFNWRLAVFLGIALMILGIAFFRGGIEPNSKKINYREFREAWDRGLVVNEGKKALKVQTQEGSSDARLIGWMRPELKDLSELELAEKSFQVSFARRTPQEQIVMDALGSQVPARVSSDLLPDLGVPQKSFSPSEFRGAMANGFIVIGDAAKPLTLHLTDYDAVLTGTAKLPVNGLPEVKDEQLLPFEVETSMYLLDTELNELIKDSGVQYLRNTDMFGRIVLTFLPVLLIILLLFFLFRQQMKAAGRGAMSFGKSKARLLTRDHNKVTFKDVAGIQEAKEELWEIVDFLRDPRKFQKLGGSIPKGVLMVGPPGTGKTLLARAIAGEADVPFFSISGSDFVEMFVGVGASRVRDMFEQGKKHAPCLIFIDEIDAVGRHRGHGLGGGHDEREQTLNQLLVEMDGFDTQEGIIIIAATNRPDVLDPALLRPGRFDRQVTVSLPDVNGREQILNVHAKKIKLTPSTDLAVIARGTPGFSGAELANLINEAALLAARKGLNAVTIVELEEARDKVRWGRERRSLAMSEKEKIATAWHEAGHALLLAKLEHSQPLHKVTIIPRGPSLGSTMWLPEGDRYSKQRKEALADLVVAVGGRIAESFYTSDISNGASGDIRMATSLARTMVCEWGMSDKLGMIEYGDGDGPVFLAREMSRSRNYSEETARMIDEEIKKLIDNAHATATEMLTADKDKVELIAHALLEFETLDASHVRDIIETGEMKNPPKLPRPPALPEEPPTKKKGSAANGAEKDDDGPLPGAVVGAPA